MNRRSFFAAIAVGLCGLASGKVPERDTLSVVVCQGRKDVRRLWFVKQGHHRLASGVLRLPRTRDENSVYQWGYTDPNTGKHVLLSRKV